MGFIVREVLKRSAKQLLIAVIVLDIPVLFFDPAVNLVQSEATARPRRDGSRSKDIVVVTASYPMTWRTKLLCGTTATKGLQEMDQY